MKAGEGQPVPGLAREIAQVGDLLTREARLAQGRVGERFHVLRAGMATAHRRAEAAVDGGRGLSGDLLVQDGLDQGGEGASPAIGLKAAGADLRHDSGEYGIGFSQVPDGPPEVGGRERRRGVLGRH
jgi:hypothetical protein